ncbi:MAG: alpha,2-mannosidase [Labilithrix sp.]|nr:alpha,2-mannosidase [Labilithrix sp.]
MNRRLLALVLAVLLPAACSTSTDAPSAAPVVPVTATATGLAAFVDPFIGTGDAVSPDPVGNGLTGATYPGAALPFGMVQFSPDTTRSDPPGYHYSDTAITAFSVTHLNGAGCAALRDLQFLPYASRPEWGEQPQAPFAHEDEKASPGFYEVKLASGIVVDLTATPRTGLSRFTFPEGAEAYVHLTGNNIADVINVAVDGFESHVVGNDTITGSRDGARFCAKASKYRIYYAVRFDRPFDTFGTTANGVDAPGVRDGSGINSGMYVHFPTDASRVVNMKVGLSYVSVEHAQANLDAEAPTFDFEATHAAALAAWNDRLAKVQVEGGDDDGKKRLYTSIYHALLQPAVFSDVDGSFIGFDGKVHVDTAHPRYANFSGWDVYRSWVQLASILAPRETSDVMRSLLGAGTECGALPRWSIANDDSGMMIGDPAAPALANAWAFGARDFDLPQALALAEKNASDPAAKCNASVARPCLAEYLAKGYCPGTGTALEGSVSITQEYAIADFAVAQLARFAGDAAASATYATRAGSWKNVFDAAAPGGPMPQPRQPDDAGGKPVFIPTPPGGRAGFTEGNPAQYTFLAPQDPYGLITALGGDAAAVTRLDALFTEVNAGVSRPYFYMGNEPQFATPWLYAYAGAAHRTQATVRRLLRETYGTTPAGLPGNDDLGATSAWQVWAMLGLYPAVPGSGTLVLGSPWFPKVVVTLGNGQALTIAASAAGPDNAYVQAFRVNGVARTGAFVTWDEIGRGGDLEVDLGPAANPAFGSAPTDRPPVP